MRSGLNYVPLPQNLYVEALTINLSEYDYIER